MSFRAALEFCESMKLKLLAIDESDKIETFINTDTTIPFESSSGKQQNIRVKKVDNAVEINIEINYCCNGYFKLGKYSSLN